MKRMCKLTTSLFYSFALTISPFGSAYAQNAFFLNHNNMMRICMGGTTEHRLAAHMCPSPNDIHQYRCMAGRTSTQWARDVAYHSCAYWVNSMICSLDYPTDHDKRVFATTPGLKAHVEGWVSRGLSLIASDAEAQCDVRECDQDKKRWCDARDDYLNQHEDLVREAERLGRERTRLNGEIANINTRIGLSTLAAFVGGLAAFPACAGGGLAAALSGGLLAFLLAPCGLAIVGAVSGGASLAYNIYLRMKTGWQLNDVEANLESIESAIKEVDTRLRALPSINECETIQRQCQQ